MNLKCIGRNTLSCAGLLVAPWTAARRAPLSVGFSRQEHCSRGSSRPGLELGSLAVQADSLPTKLRGKLFGRDSPI